MVINLEGIDKVVGKNKKILSDLSISVEAGERIALLGVNGSGKSTAIKIMTGVMTPTNGKCTVFGMDPIKHRKEINKKIGVIFGHRSSLFWELPLIDSYKFIKYMYDIREKEFETRISELVALLDLEDLINRPIKTFSLGQRAKAELGSVLLHRPEILILDEPTLGLDIIAKDVIKKYLIQYCDKNKTTLIITSHDFNDIDSLCYRTIIISNGKKIYDNNFSLITEEINKKKLISLFLDSSESYKEVMNKLVENKNIEKISYDNGVLSFEIQSLFMSKEFLGSLLDLNQVQDLQVSSIKLDEVIKSIFTDGE